MSTWVLLRGLMRESRHWGDFPARLQQALGGSIVTPDMPGNGKLYQQSSPLSVQDMTEACRLQLQQLGHPPPYQVLAMSLGAMVAIDWATRYPQELQCMVLINTSLASYSPFYQRLRPRNYLALSYALALGSLERRERVILRVTSNLHRGGVQQQALLSDWYGYARACPVTRGNVLKQLYAASRYRAALHRPALPVLMLASSNDALVDVRCSQAIAKRWGCRLLEHPSAGHDLPLDDGVWVIQRVRAWRASPSLFE